MGRREKEKAKKRLQIKNREGAMARLQSITHPFGVPPEIRQTILRHVLSGARLRYHCKLSPQRESEKVKPWTTPEKDVLLVCRRLYQEGKSIYYNYLELEVFKCPFRISPLSFMAWGVQQNIQSICMEEKSLNQLAVRLPYAMPALRDIKVKQFSDYSADNSVPPKTTEQAAEKLLQLVRDNIDTRISENSPSGMGRLLLLVREGWCVDIHQEIYLVHRLTDTSATYWRFCVEFPKMECILEHSFTT